MYTTQLNNTPKSLKRRKLKKQPQMLDGIKG